MLKLRLSIKVLLWEQRLIKATTTEVRKKKEGLDIDRRGKSVYILSIKLYNNSRENNL